MGVVERGGGECPLLCCGRMGHLHPCIRAPCVVTGGGPCAAVRGYVWPCAVLGGAVCGDR